MLSYCETLTTHITGIGVGRATWESILWYINQERERIPLGPVDPVALTVAERRLSCLLFTHPVLIHRQIWSDRVLLVRGESRGVGFVRPSRAVVRVTAFDGTQQMDVHRAQRPSDSGRRLWTSGYSWNQLIRSALRFLRASVSALCPCKDGVQCGTDGFSATLGHQKQQWQATNLLQSVRLHLF